MQIACSTVTGNAPDVTIHKDHEPGKANPLYTVTFGAYRQSTYRYERACKLYADYCRMQTSDIDLM